MSGSARRAGGPAIISCLHNYGYVLSTTRISSPLQARLERLVGARERGDGDVGGTAAADGARGGRTGTRRAPRSPPRTRGARARPPHAAAAGARDRRRGAGALGTHLSAQADRGTRVA